MFYMYDFFFPPFKVDQGPPLHPMTPNLHNVPNVPPSPIVSDAYGQRIVHPGMESVPEHPHLLSDALSDQMQQTPLDKQMPTHSPLTNQMSQSIQDHLSQSNAISNLPCIENNLHPCPENGLMQPHLDSHMLQPLQQQQPPLQQPPLQQPSLQPHNACLAEDYSQTQTLEDANAIGATVSNMLPNEHNNLPLVSDHIPEPNTQNCAPETELNQTVNQQPSESNSVFDALSNDFRLKNLQENNTQLQTQENENQQNVPNTTNAADKNDFPVSDEDDDYGAPGSVGPVSILFNICM